MKISIIPVFILLLCLSCNSQKNDGNSIAEKVYTFEEFKAEFQETFDLHENDTPIGIWFWDEYGEYEKQYNLPDYESKLLGRWFVINFSEGTSNHGYYFFPNRFCVLKFPYKTIQFNAAENLFLDKAMGTWDISDGVVRVTVHTIMIENFEIKSRFNKDVFLVERPYMVDFISIYDIGEEGYTKRSINDTILSEELQKQVTVLKPQTPNSLYARIVWSMDFSINRKYYSFFTFFPDMAQDNVSGLKIATDLELIRKYIPDWLH